MLSVLVFVENEKTKLGYSHEKIQHFNKQVKKQSPETKIPGLFNMLSIKIFLYSIH
ncbi:transposase [Bacillus sp. IT-79MI2]|nr:hypothetical protein BTH41_03562 [Bacillus mycoides]